MVLRTSSYEYGQGPTQTKPKKAERPGKGSKSTTLRTSVLGLKDVHGYHPFQQTKSLFGDDQRGVEEAVFLDQLRHLESMMGTESGAAAFRQLKANHDTRQWNNPKRK